MAESTYNELERKMRRLHRALNELRSAGKISSTSPATLNRDDIAAFIMWMREEEHSGTYQSKNLDFLKQVCVYAGNNVFARMSAEGVKLPTKTYRELESLTEDQLKNISKAAETIRGWRGEVARFLVAVYPCSGLRPSELRLAHLEDIDTKEWTIFVRHPKGEKSYARKRYAPIMPQAKSAVLRFLKAREERLKGKGAMECEALIPAWHGGQFGFYSANNLRAVKKKVEDATGIDFELRTFRNTYCQRNIDARPENLTAVSRSMGHASTTTTERHYGRIRPDKALKAIREVWEPKDAQSPLIEDKFGISGYG